MSGVEGVPLRMPLGALQEQQEEVQLITAPQITVPNYLTVLRDTEYEFSLEKWVLTGLQEGYPSQPRPQAPCSPSELLPSCPPYWQMFSSPQQSRLASRHSSDFWEPNPRQRSRSLNPADLRAKVEFNISDSEDEGVLQKAMEERGGASKAKTPETSSPSGGPKPVVRKAQRAFTPDLLNPPACLSSLPHQRRKNLRQCSPLVLKTPSGEEEQNTFSPTGPPHQPKTPQAPHRPPNTRANTIHWVPNIMHHKPTCPSLSPYVSLPPPPSVTSRPLGSIGAALDSSVELLSALGPEERELLEAITARGYPLRTAILALQKTGQQTPEQVHLQP